MSSEDKIKAFVASTYHDLKDHRAHVIAELRKAGVIVDPMEDWTATQEEPKVFSKDRLEGCDYCILLVAFRRGFIPPGEKESITQMEYRYALANQIHVLPFVLDEKAPWPREWDEMSSDPEVAQWRRELLDRHGCGTFGQNPSSIQVTQALLRAFREVEFKYSSLANAQFKFQSIEDADSVINKFLHLCSLFDIEREMRVDLEITDEYYDDRKHTFNELGCSLRRRTKGEKHFVTCKARVPGSDMGGLERREKEFELEEAAFVEMKKSNFSKILKDVFFDTFNVQLSPGPISPVLTVCNRRTMIPFRTKAARYTFNYDKYFFRVGSDYSEYFNEIEVEVEEGEASNDEARKKLLTALCALLGFQQGEETQKSKFQRGMEWAVRKDSDTTPICAMMLTIMDYDKFDTPTQKQVIQALNHFTKDAIAEQGYDHRALIVIPAADGIIIVTEKARLHRIEDLISILLRAQDKIAQDHNAESSEQSFEFKSGILSGSVFRYTDVCENLNYGGKAFVQLRNLMQHGKAWHILATRGVFHALDESDDIYQSIFHPVKRKGEVILYNVYDEDGHGNPQSPL